MFSSDIFKKQPNHVSSKTWPQNPSEKAISSFLQNSATSRLHLQKDILRSSLTEYFIRKCLKTSQIINYKFIHPFISSTNQKSTYLVGRSWPRPWPWPWFHSAYFNTLECKKKKLLKLRNTAKKMLQVPGRFKRRWRSRFWHRSWNRSFHWFAA